MKNRNIENFGNELLVAGLWNCDRIDVYLNESIKQQKEGSFQHGLCIWVLDCCKIDTRTNNILTKNKFCISEKDFIPKI